MQQAWVLLGWNGKDLHYIESISVIYASIGDAVDRRQQMMETIDDYKWRNILVCQIDMPVIQLDKL